MQRGFIGFIRQTMRFSQENIEYFASCVLSKDARLYEDQNHITNH